MRVAVPVDVAVGVRERCAVADVLAERDAVAGAVADGLLVLLRAADAVARLRG